MVDCKLTIKNNDIIITAVITTCIKKFKLMNKNKTPLPQKRTNKKDT